jgi:hypothetical protein
MLRRKTQHRKREREAEGGRREIKESLMCKILNIIIFILCVKNEMR